MTLDFSQNTRSNATISGEAGAVTKSQVLLTREVTAPQSITDISYIIISPSFDTLLKRRREITVKMETTVARAQALPSVAFATAL